MGNPARTRSPLIRSIQTLLRASRSAPAIAAGAAGRPRRFFLPAIALFALAFATGATPSPAPGSAVIVNSGSTNTAGYRIVVTPDGHATATKSSHVNVPDSAPQNLTLDDAFTSRFFLDLQAARDANATGLPCMKSASFGSTTYVEWNGWKSPDLSCPSDNEKLKALENDLQALLRLAGW